MLCNSCILYQSHIFRIYGSVLYIRKKHTYITREGRLTACCITFFKSIFIITVCSGFVRQQTWIQSLVDSSSGACHGCSHCHELSPCRSVLHISLGWRQAKVHWLQVGLHRSQPGLSGSAGPPSPLHRRAHDASLEGAVMILPRVGAAEVTIERETTTTEWNVIVSVCHKVWQLW